jgi:3-oxoacyl-[acyl-carrier protein] reductase
MDTGLKGRVAIVAASSQGIGRATARALAAEGCNLAMCARNAEVLGHAADAIRSEYQVEVHSQALDVTDAAALREFVVSTADRFGRIDIAVANAGGPPAKGFLATSPEEWRRAFELNMLSTVALAQAVIPHMQKRKWGRIVIISSVAVKQPVPDLVLSNAVRGGVLGLVRSLANEFGKDGILVNNVGPGYTATDRLLDLAAARAKITGEPEQKFFDAWCADSPLGRLGKPEEVADAIVWLASERASFITGQTILVDGGAYRGI